MNKIAIIGTAGRDKSKPMTMALWEWMVNDAVQRVPKGAHLVSGGAAWADHLAVELFLMDHAAKLTLHLPAPFKDYRFVGPSRSSASAANYYHGEFSAVINHQTLGDIAQCEHARDCDGTYEDADEGYSGMFKRNDRIAKSADVMLAYTFGVGPQPADGGTRHTWDRFTGQKTHIELPSLYD